MTFYLFIYLFFSSVDSLNYLCFPFYTTLVIHHCVFCKVASQETYGTLGAIVRSQTGNRQVGFLTNRHVAVDLDYPNQKMFHPLPPTLGPGVYLGAVERATSFITDELWYGIFAGINPGNEDFITSLINVISIMMTKKSSKLLPWRVNVYNWTDYERNGLNLST